MERKTQTTLGELRIGDRFHYTKSHEVWQVMKHTNSHTFVNLPIGNKGKMMHKYDEMKKKDTQVVFLRHTEPMPGEEVLLECLHEGDVFCFPDSIVHEYRVLRPVQEGGAKVEFFFGSNMVSSASVFDTDKHISCKRDTLVVFLRRE